MNHEVLKEIGIELKMHRQAAGLSLSELSKTLRIRKHYLESIEKANRKNLPSEAYIIGYIKHYAKQLGLNEKDFIDRLKLAKNNKLASVASDNLITDKEFMPGKLVLYISLSLFILLYLLVYFIFYR